MLEIPDQPNYFVSEDGQIWSTKSGRLKPLSLFDGGHGYLAVNLTQNGKYRMHRVHVFVTRTFHGPKPSEKHKALHWDDKRTNNTPSNLRWGLHADNTADMLRNGGQAKGERVSGAKLTEADVTAIRFALKNGETRTAVKARFGIDTSHIHAVAKRLTWKHLKD